MNNNYKNFIPKLANNIQSQLNNSPAQTDELKFPEFKYIPSKKSTNITIQGKSIISKEGAAVVNHFEAAIYINNPEIYNISYTIEYPAHVDESLFFDSMFVIGNRVDISASTDLYAYDFVSLPFDYKIYITIEKL
jgi:hypothetical protein